MFVHVCTSVCACACVHVCQSWLCVCTCMHLWRVGIGRACSWAPTHYPEHFKSTESWTLSIQIHRTLSDT